MLIKKSLNYKVYSKSFLLLLKLQLSTDLAFRSLEHPLSAFELLQSYTRVVQDIFRIIILMLV